MNAPTTIANLRQQGGAPGTEVAKTDGVKKQFDAFMTKLQPQLARALPVHMKADRMARLALTAFSSSKEMQECSFSSIASSLMTAGALGLEPGINGAGFLIPYRGTCTFVPGWKGMVDLVSRSGRASVWTGAVFAGDHFEYELGDRPFVRHRPGDESDPLAMSHVYAVGRVNGAEWPIVEVWSVNKVKRHRDKFNKQGGKHYSFREPEMYGRKVPLLQVLKYLPSSIEISNALAASEAGEAGRSAGVVIDGDFVHVTDPGDSGADGGDGGAADAGADADRSGRPTPPSQGGQAQLGNDPSPTISGEAFGTRQRATIRREDPEDAVPARQQAAPTFDPAAFEARMAGCKDVDTLDLMADELRTIGDAEVADSLSTAYRRIRDVLTNSARPAGATGATGRRAGTQAAARTMD